MKSLAIYILVLAFVSAQSQYTNTNQFLAGVASKFSISPVDPSSINFQEDIIDALEAGFQYIADEGFSTYILNSLEHFCYRYNQNSDKSKILPFHRRSYDVPQKSPVYSFKVQGLAEAFRKGCSVFWADQNYLFPIVWTKIQNQFNASSKRMFYILEELIQKKEFQKAGTLVGNMIIKFFDQYNSIQSTQVKLFMTGYFESYKFDAKGPVSGLLKVEPNQYQYLERIVSKYPNGDWLNTLAESLTENVDRTFNLINLYKNTFTTIYPQPFNEIDQLKSDSQLFYKKVLSLINQENFKTLFDSIYNDLKNQRLQNAGKAFGLIQQAIVSVKINYRDDAPY